MKGRMPDALVRILSVTAMIFSFLTFTPSGQIVARQPINPDSTQLSAAATFHVTRASSGSRPPATTATESFTISFRPTALDNEAAGTALVVIQGRRLTVHVKARSLPLPARWHQTQYSLWVDLPNYGYKLYLGDLPVSTPSADETFKPVWMARSDELPSRKDADRSRGSSDTVFRLDKLPPGAIFGGLIVTAEPPQHGAIINEPLFPLLIARADGGDIEMGSLNDRAIKTPVPDYPELARQTSITGLVKVSIEVDENGNVRDVRHASGSPLLVKSAATAARKWKFQPVVITGQRVGVKGFIEMWFAGTDPTVARKSSQPLSRPADPVMNAEIKPPRKEIAKHPEVERSKKTDDKDTKPGSSKIENKPSLNNGGPAQPSRPVTPIGDRPQTTALAVSGGVTPGKILRLPKPSYPLAAKASGLTGKVVVEVTLDEKGNIVSARALSGNPKFRFSAEEAARLARFEPTLLSGQPVKATRLITYNFSPR